VNRIYKVLVPGLIAAAVWAAPVSAADLKVGVVNMGRLYQGSPQAKAADDAMRAEFAPKEKELQATQVQLKAKEEKLQKDAATMSESQRSSAEKELRDGYRDLARRQQEAQDDFNARRNEETSRLQRSLFEEITTYAKAQGFDLVLADGVIYSNPTLDITPAILTVLQTRKPAGAAKPAAK
jgi:outer membrane protein